MGGETEDNEYENNGSGGDPDFVDGVENESEDEDDGNDGDVEIREFECHALYVLAINALAKAASSPPRKKLKLVTGKPKVKAKTKTVPVKPRFSKERFATEKDYHSELLEAGWDVIVGNLRTACYKHKANHRTSQVDRDHGSLGESAHRTGQESLVGRFAACGCTMESHIFDLLAYKVHLVYLYLTCNISFHTFQDPAQEKKSISDGVLQSPTAFNGGTVDQRKVYIRLLTDVTHSAFPQMLQHEVLQTIDVIYQSLYWLHDLDDASLFHNDDEGAEVEELREEIIRMTETFSDWRLNVRGLWQE